jgi:catechol 2,3-dioxygenase-like lactoylglutathione lyase family enzyme
MSLANDQSTFLSIAPRFVVTNLEQALAFYRQLGFQTTYQDEDFAIVTRDSVDLHLNHFPDALERKCSVCWIAVTNSEPLYQRYLPTNAIHSPLRAQPWGLKEFSVGDPFGNLIIFAERLPEADASSDAGSAG